MALNSLWNRLTEVSTQPDRRSLRLWVWIREKLDLALYKPQPASNVQISSLIGRRGQYYILKNPEAVTYYQISERDYFIWEKMDGTLSVKDLVIEYFLKYGSFAFARIARFVYGLKLNSMLADQPVNIYQQVNLRLHERRLGYRLQQFGSAFMQKPFAIHGIDGLIDWLYRWGGWLLFTRPLQVMYIIISAVGIVLFVRAFQAPTYNLFAVNGSYWLGLIALAVILLFTLLTHEFAHALTVKNYGREVRRAGLMIYLGMPGFFVDTSDIWMEGKRARLAVTWAGPFSGLVLSGIAAIILTIWPEFSLNPVLFRFAFLSYVIVFMNVNPLIKLDGYYLLMDWLEIPNLRSKSFAFLRNGLPGKFKAKDAGGMSQKRLKWVPNFGSFSREELIFTIFGLLSALWTAYAVYMGINIWQTRMVVALQSLIDWGGDLTQLPITLLVLLLSVVFVSMISLFIWGLLRRVYLQAANRGIFSDTWYVAGLLLALTLALLFVDSISTLPFLGTLIGLVALLLALIFAWKNAQNYAGSRYSAFFWLSGLAALVWMIVVIYTSLNEFTLLPIGYEGATLSVFSIIPLIALLIACVSLWIGRDIKAISLVEWGVILFGILVSAGYVLWAIMVENIR
jgi:putative peptide zinc metalloprotease protein